MSKDAADLMEEAMKTFEAKSDEYGSTYHQFGHIMKALFPEGVTVQKVDDWNRLGVLVQIVGKLARYTINFRAGGHQDSIHDIGVYAFMLEELDLVRKANQSFCGDGLMEK